MARNDDGRDDEIDALEHAEGVDPVKIMEQISKGKGIKSEDKAPDLKLEDIKPGEIKPEEQKPGEIKPDEKKEVPDPEAIVSGKLKEIFGDRYTNVDELKKANIPAQLQELETLRQKNQTLETQLKAKPKHPFASDDIAKFNEFVRDTGIKDVGVFNKINGADVANMGDMDALVMQHIVENPSLANKEPQVRRYFETKYNVDAKKVEAGDLTQDELDVNLIGVASDGARAKDKLQELKGKIKMPDIPADEPLEGKQKWTPEIETKQKAEWAKVNEKMGEEFAKIPIPIKGGTEPIVNFVLPEETKKTILTNALDYAIGNQLEINEANVTSVATMMYSDLIVSNLGQIVHTVFERARTMTEDEVLKVYHNPSPKNTDTPPPSGEPESDEAKREKAYQAEFDR